MWVFDGVIHASCDNCQHVHLIEVGELNVDCYDSSYHENGMGAENNYELSQVYNCERCGAEFEINFDATEYPVDMLSYVINRSTGVSCSGEPYFTYIDDEPTILLPEQDIYVPDQRIITDLSEIHNTIPNLIRLIQQDNSYIYRISPREFEEVVAELFRNNGYQVTLTKRTRDGGKDVIAVNKDVMGVETSYFIECKRHSESNKVDVGIVRELYGVHSSLNGPNKSIIATTSTFTPDARKFVNEELRSKWDMDLRDINDVLAWVSRYKPQANKQLLPDW